MQTMREYETLFVIKPDSSDDSMKQVQTRLEGVLDKEGAKLLRYNIWGKKKLAFEVAKNPKGIMVQLQFLSPPTCIQELERNLRLIEPVVRYQTIKVAEQVDVDKRIAEQQAEDRARSAAEAEAKAREEAREAAQAQQKEEEQMAQGDNDDDYQNDDEDYENGSGEED